MKLIFTLLFFLPTLCFSYSDDVKDQLLFPCDKALSVKESQAFYMGSVTYTCTNGNKIKFDYTPSLSRGVIFFNNKEGTYTQTVTQEQQLKALASSTLFLYKDSDEYKLKKQYEYRLPVKEIKSDYR